MSLIIAKLTRGPRTLNINDLTNYELGTDFNPPAVAIDPVYARGGSDWWTPGKMVGIKAQNRSFTFGIHVYGTTEATVRTRIRTLNDFLISGTQAEPVYLEVLGNSDVSFQPLWGQSGAYYRYEILTGRAEINDYAWGGIRNSALPECNVNLTIAPYALGRKQLLANAKGCIIEDVIGVADGLSRGVTVGKAVTNLITNPIFGNGAWDTDWTAGGSLTAEQNIDRAYTLPDRMVSAKLISPAAGTNLFTQSLTAAGAGLTWTISLYVRLLGGGALSSFYCQVWYDSAQTSTYQSLGNGIYLVSATITTLAGARLVGIKVNNGFTVHLLAAQCEAASTHSPLVHGDMLGCTWSGTRHASSSTSQVGSLNVYARAIYNNAQGTIRIVWKPDKSSTSFTGDNYFYQDTSTNFSLCYDGTNHVFTFRDGTNTLNTSAVTFSAYETIILHIQWGNASVNVYKNGANILTSLLYSPPAVPDNVYIGSDWAPSHHIMGVLMGFTAFDLAMSSSEVIADYTNQAGIAAADKRVDWLPFLNTTYGSGRIYNANTANTSHKWGAIHGIPGSLPADTEWEGYLSPSWSTIKSVWLSLLDTDMYVHQHVEMNKDNSGSADAACEGGEYHSQTVTTSEITTYSSVEQNVFCYPAFAGREYALFVRLQDASGASGLQGRNRYYLYTQSYSTDLQSIASSTSWRTWISSMLTFVPITIAKVSNAFLWYYSSEKFIPIRTAGSWALKVDYTMVMFRPLVRLRSSGTIDEHDFYFHGRQAFLHSDSAPSLYVCERLSVKGDVIDLVPEKWNILTVHMGDIDFDPVITYYVQLYFVQVTPRWGLL